MKELADYQRQQQLRSEGRKIQGVPYLKAAIATARILDKKAKKKSKREKRPKNVYLARIQGKGRFFDLWGSIARHDRFRLLHMRYGRASTV